ncbi:hypothetical protein FRB94_002595 [Tulasnella sp. JGI-2019a]|nr:hypothetical protein FRB93_004943 [Tulasnella sp. JGI-2019a]KAG9004239.1 hypothetical protein FRB94_002595 [Tulasnella sp. JGI-2019a]
MLSIALAFLLLTGPTPVQPPDVSSVTTSAITLHSRYYLKIPSSSNILGPHELHNNESRLHDDVFNTAALRSARPVHSNIPLSNEVTLGLGLLVVDYVANSSSTFIGPVISQAQLLDATPSCDSQYVYGATLAYTCRAVVMVPAHEGFTTNHRPHLRLKSVCSERCRVWSIPTPSPAPSSIGDMHLHRDPSETNTDESPALTFVGVANLDARTDGDNSIALQGPTANQPPGLEDITLRARDARNAKLSVVLVLIAILFCVAFKIHNFAFVALYWNKGHLVIIIFVTFLSHNLTIAALYWNKGHREEITGLKATIETEREENRRLQNKLDKERQEAGDVKSSKNAEITHLRTVNNILAITVQSESRSAQALLRDSVAIMEEERRQRIFVEEENTNIRDDVKELVDTVHMLKENLNVARDGQTLAKNQAKSVKAICDGLLRSVGEMRQKLANAEVERDEARSTIESQRARLGTQAGLIQSMSATISQLQSDDEYAKAERRAELKNAQAAARDGRTSGRRSLLQSAIHGLAQNAPPPRHPPA